MVVLMGANDVKCEKDDNQFVYYFEQLTPIPSYLLAIACGFIESRKIGPRSKVWSEKGNIESAAYEFEEVFLFFIKVIKQKYLYTKKN